jgi:hypothetical protein
MQDEVADGVSAPKRPPPDRFSRQRFDQFGILSCHNAEIVGDARSDMGRGHTKIFLSVIEDMRSIAGHLARQVTVETLG